MAFSAQDIQKLERAVIDLATGDRAIELEFNDGSRVRYAGLTEVQRILATAQANVTGINRRRSIRVRVSKGL
jgi:hypothetical protein